MSKLYNLVVDLNHPFPTPPARGIDVQSFACADERTLAWIDETFGGSWSSEANAGSNVIARAGELPVGFATIEPQGLRFAWLNGLGREPGVGIFGPFGVAPERRKAGLGVLLLRLGLNELRRRGYSRALIPAVNEDRLLRYYSDAVGARIGEEFERDLLYRPGRRAVIMASGNGTNFQAVLDASAAGYLAIDIVGLVSNNPRAYAIERARNAGLDSIESVIWNRQEETRAAYDARLLDVVRSRRPDVVVMLGWMHLLPDAFLSAFASMLNLHPAFLPLDPARDDVVTPDGLRIPAFRGPRAIGDALAASSEWVGATLHCVTSDTDRGPVMARKPLRIEPEEAEDHLLDRVHEIERGVVRAGMTRWLFER
ncbi:MAG: GNAT family N-acetyltransferase [Candidatus Eremiobacteraeota bacterium]|nr:GNAT family N-acetyltransferase [Candidatus Eremiobacteraeota bacterium]